MRNILIAILLLTIFAADAGCSSEPHKVEVEHKHRIILEWPKTEPNQPRPLQSIIDQIKSASKPQPKK